MLGSDYRRLLAHARQYAGPDDAEDVLQEALIAGLREGRTDLTHGQNAAWLRGVIRNLARMHRRSAGRRRRRDGEWQDSRSLAIKVGSGQDDLLPTLPAALRVLALLTLTGHSRHEIANLLSLSDPALRQRIVALKRHLRAAGLGAPEEFSGLSLDLAYGRLRDALLPQLHRQGGLFASHDPDGHLFVVRRSQNQ